MPPRATEILKAAGVMGGSPFFEPRHRIRGTLVHDAAGIVGLDGVIPAQWWMNHSGDPAYPTTYVPHEECRPHIEAYGKWKRYSGWRIEPPLEREVKFLNLFIGHIDQLGNFDPRRELPAETITYPELLDTWILDLKNGEEESWHRLQLAMYHLGLQMERPKARIHRANLYLPSGKFIERTDPRDLRSALILAQAYAIRMEYAA